MKEVIKTYWVVEWHCPHTSKWGRVTLPNRSSARVRMKSFKLLPEFYINVRMFKVTEVQVSDKSILCHFEVKR